MTPSEPSSFIRKVGAAIKNKRGPKERYLLVKGRYGLGNRILFLLSAIVSARASGRRLVIDWDDGLYGPEGINAFPRYFASPATIPVSELPPDLSVEPVPWRNTLEASYYGQVRKLGIPERHSSRQLSADLCDFSSTADCLVVVGTKFNSGLLRRRHVLPPEWKDMTQETLVRTLLREVLKPTPHLQSIVGRFVKDRFSRPVIGVHVRYTDNLVSYNLDSRGTVFPEISIQAVARRLEQQPKSSVFLATDSPEILASFQSTFPKVIHYEKWFADGGRALHQAAKRVGYDTEKMAEAALVELFLLAACDHIVFDSRSSFAQLAAYWSKSSSEDVAAENLRRAELGN